MRAAIPAALILAGASGIAACTPGPVGVASLPAGNLADGLIGHWTFDEGLGAIAHDSSGNGRDGSIFGPGWSWTAGRFGSALHFGGMDQVTVGAFPPATASFSVAAWVRVASTELGGAPISAVLSTEAGFGGWSLNVGIPPMPSYGFGYATSATTRAVALCSCLVADAWAHVAAVVDGGSTLTMYVNGVPQTTIAGTTAIAPGDATLYMGRWSGPGRMLTAAVDDVAIYSRALVPEEVALLASAPAVDPR